MKKFSLVAFLLTAALSISIPLFASSNPPSMRVRGPNESPLPTPTHAVVSPLPQPQAQNSAGNAGQPSVEVGSSDKLILRTNSRPTVGWWDKNDNFHETPVIDGKADIPAEAYQISMPGEYQGIVPPAGWKKGQRSNGEWVLMRA